VICLFGSQVDVHSTRFKRDDRDTRAIWGRLKEELGDAAPSDGPEFTKHGISHNSMLSDPCLFWELQATTTTRNAVVDWFHNGAEGHAHLFCDAFFKLISPEAVNKVKQVWNDPAIWGPLIGSIPKFPATKLASMSGTEKEYVAKHADILFWPLFKPGLPEDAMERYFKPTTRWSLACRLTGEDFESRARWTQQQWRQLFANEPFSWRSVYEEYIYPLSSMMRKLSSVTQTRARLAPGGDLDRTIKEYISGARLVLGRTEIENKSIFHRLRHLPAQAKGASSGVTDIRKGI
jgi:hypothetical protein